MSFFRLGDCFPQLGERISQLGGLFPQLGERVFRLGELFPQPKTCFPQPAGSRPQPAPKVSRLGERSGQPHIKSRPQRDAA